ncbi:hypothetical protein C8F01DRAFT_1226018 [Mycena amicta]|nr:hypothetical protein C8F01DRAFT_1226018 [Mycena amicta]
MRIEISNPAASGLSVSMVCLGWRDNGSGVPLGDGVDDNTDMTTASVLRDEAVHFGRYAAEWNDMTQNTESTDFEEDLDRELGICVLTKQISEENNGYRRQLSSETGTAFIPVELSQNEAVELAVLRAFRTLEPDQNQDEAKEENGIEAEEEAQMEDVELEPEEEVDAPAGSLMTALMRWKLWWWRWSEGCNATSDLRPPSENSAGTDHDLNQTSQDQTVSIWSFNLPRLPSSVASYAYYIGQYYCSWASYPLLLALSRPRWQVSVNPSTTPRVPCCAIALLVLGIAKCMHKDQIWRVRHSGRRIGGMDEHQMLMGGRVNWREDTPGKDTGNGLYGWSEERARGAKDPKEREITAYPSSVDVACDEWLRGRIGSREPGTSRVDGVYGVNAIRKGLGEASGWGENEQELERDWSKAIRARCSAKTCLQWRWDLSSSLARMYHTRTLDSAGKIWRPSDTVSCFVKRCERRECCEGPEYLRRLS